MGGAGRPGVAGPHRSSAGQATWGNLAAAMCQPPPAAAMPFETKCCCCTPVLHNAPHLLPAMSMTMLEAASACTAQAGKGPLQAGRQVGRQRRRRASQQARCAKSLHAWMPLSDAAGWLACMCQNRTSSIASSATSSGSTGSSTNAVPELVVREVQGGGYCIAIQQGVPPHQQRQPLKLRRHLAAQSVAVQGEHLQRAGGACRRLLRKLLQAAAQLVGVGLEDGQGSQAAQRRGQRACRGWAGEAIRDRAGSGLTALTPALPPRRLPCPTTCRAAASLWHNSATALTCEVVPLQVQPRQLRGLPVSGQRPAQPIVAQQKQLQLALPRKACRRTGAGGAAVLGGRQGLQSARGNSSRACAASSSTGGSGWQPAPPTCRHAARQVVVPQPQHLQPVQAAPLLRDAAAAGLQGRGADGRQGAASVPMARTRQTRGVHQAAAAASNPAQAAARGSQTASSSHKRHPHPPEAVVLEMNVAHGSGHVWQAAGEAVVVQLQGLELGQAADVWDGPAQALHGRKESAGERGHAVRLPAQHKRAQVGQVTRSTWPGPHSRAPQQ